VTSSRSESVKVGVGTGLGLVDGVELAALGVIVAAGPPGLQANTSTTRQAIAAWRRTEVTFSVVCIPNQQYAATGRFSGRRFP
jgi:hypothetical protein